MNKFFSGLIRSRAATAAMLAASLASLAGPTPARGDTLWWNTTSGTWSTLANWSTAFSGGSAPVAPQTVPGANDTAIFNTSGVTVSSTAILGANTSLGGISVLATATSAVTIRAVTTARTLTLGAGGITMSADQSFSLGSTTASQAVNVELAASQAWTSTQAISTRNFNVRNGVQRAAGAASMTLLAENSGNLNFDGIIADGAGGGKLSLWKRGSGATNFTVANTYSGTTTMQAGTFNVGNASGLGASALQLAGGTLNVSGSTTFTAPSTVTVLGGVNLLTVTATSAMNLGTISRSVGGGLLARSLHLTGSNITVSNSLTNGIIGPWAYGQSTGVNVPTWLTTNSGTLASATLTAATNANNLTSATTSYSSAAGITLTADRSAYVWANTMSGTAAELANFNLTLSGFANGAQPTTLSGTGTGRLVIGGGELVVIPSNGSIVISAGIASGAGHLTLAPFGIGNITLSGSNAHSGGTSLHKNTLNINNANALGTGTFTIAAGSIDNSSAAPLTLATNNAQVWNSDFTFVGTRNLSMGTGSVSLGSYAGATRTVTVSSSKLTVGGGIVDGSHSDLPTTALTKAGVGVLELSGSNTYTGPTTISAGSLFVNGRNTGTGAFSVAAAALLGGSGTIAGPVSVSGTLSPGSGTGVLTVGSLALDSTSTTLLQISGTSRGSLFDAVTATGGAGVGYGGALSLVFTGTNYSGTFDLFNFLASSGSFSSVSATGDYGLFSFTQQSSGTWKAAASESHPEMTFSQTTGDLVIVPEPATLALAGIGIAAAAWTLRRRRR